MFVFVDTTYCTNVLAMICGIVLYCRGGVCDLHEPSRCGAGTRAHGHALQPLLPQPLLGALDGRQNGVPDLQKTTASSLETPAEVQPSQTMLFRANSILLC